MKRHQVKDLVRSVHVEWLRSHFTHIGAIHVWGSVLIVAPHPDDEVIGCGGLIARLVGEDRAPHIAVMTGGEGSHRGCCNLPGRELREARRGLTRQALSILGVPEANIHELDYPDGGISAESQQTEKLRELIGRLRPQAVFVPHWGEGWPDHVRTAEIVKNIVDKDVEVYEYCVWMWYYNVWRGLDWKNACKLEMTRAERELKLRAVDAYLKPLAPCGRPWSGVLPKIFIDANRGSRELYFKVK